MSVWVWVGVALDVDARVSVFCFEEVSCSGGTYIRVLVKDIARQLGSCAHVQELQRTRQGAFCLHRRHHHHGLRQQQQQMEGRGEANDNNSNDVESLPLPLDEHQWGQPELIAQAIQQTKRFLLSTGKA